VCGIVGFFGDGERGDLKRLVDQLIHRGPDGSGLYVDESAGIYVGHRRLAIRDIAGGAQPMTSHDSRYVLSFNGEIYNDRALRDELISCGHRFLTLSDSEVVLRSMIQWGVAALPQLDGQFAFCFVDKQARRVVLARDRFGEKPLFWSMTPNGLLFSSESSVLASHPWIVPRLHEENCLRFLLLGYLPPPDSVLEGVHQLRPGYVLEYDVRQAEQPTPVCFAQPWSEFPESTGSSKQEVFDLDLLARSVSSRRVSDVEVGVLLSGGVDSSLVTTAAVLSGWRPTAYTMGFASESFDETRAAGMLAQSLGLAHRVGRMTFANQEEVLKTLRSLDEPLADSSYLPTYEVFRLAASDSKVLLTGDGGDELFFGYEPFRAQIISQKFCRFVPPQVSRVLSRLAGGVPRTSSYMNKLEVAERFFDGLEFEPPLRIAVWMSTLRTRRWGRFIVDAPDPRELFSMLGNIEDPVEPLEKSRRFFLRNYLPGSIFAKSDTASMASSVEARTVFLYPSIIRHALGRSGSQEIGWRHGKKSLRRVAREAGLGAVARRRKHGFAMPLLDVLRGLDIEPPRPGLRRLRQEAIDEEWRRMRAGERVDSQFLWALVALVNSRAYRVAKS
jgi:asparagine synthase (glutamine-hydrolysing)